MRSHVKVHDKERQKVCCSVRNCVKKYSDLKAWTVHFNKAHERQSSKFDFYKRKLKFEKVQNVEQTPINKVLLENIHLKEEIRKLLNIRTHPRTEAKAVAKKKPMRSKSIE